MQEQTSRNGLQYDIRSLPESWRRALTRPIVYSLCRLLSYQSSSIWTVCFPTCFGMTVAFLFYGSVQVVHIILQPAFRNTHEGGQYQRGKSAPEEAIQFLLPVSVSLACQVRIFDKLAATVATFVILFAPTSHAIFHHIVRTTSGTSQIGFYDETPQKTGHKIIILHPLHKSTTRNSVILLTENYILFAQKVKKKQKLLSISKRL